MYRRVLLIGCAGMAFAAAAPPAAAEPTDYAQVADRLVGALAPLWRAGRYDAGGGLAATDVNANLLMVYSIAAEQGLTGRLRDDARAREIVRFLTRPPIWRP